MTETNRAENSNPLSTVDDIQRRLLRPPFLHSPKFKVDSTDFERKQEAKARETTTNKKLEDYLDPVLLSAISAKIGGGHVKKDTSTKLMKKREVRDLEWPVDKLKVFMEDSRISNNEAVNLNDDLDLSNDGEGGGGEICTPFKRFELTALKRFKR